MHFEIFISSIAVIVAVRLFWTLFRELTSPLRAIKGPALARWTRWWYFSRVYHGQFELENIALHRKYGKIVRIAPNHYSIDDPAVIKTIYGISSSFPKSDWYFGFANPADPRNSIFPERNIRRHAEFKRKFQALYSMTSVIGYEPLVDECADLLADHLDKFAELKEKVNIGHWFQCYAFDVIGNITFGKRFGFLDNGEDVGGIMSALSRHLQYSVLIGIFAEWHPFLFKQMQRFSHSGVSGRVYLMNFVQGIVGSRMKQEKQPTQITRTTDFLNRMIETHNNDPEKITFYHMFSMGLANIIAGSDTTSVSLSAVLLYLLQNPHCLEKLRQEIVHQTELGLLSEKPTFKETQAMPYLQAVIKEGMRMHAATGLPLWRVVPAGGCELSGHFFPEGSVVGVNTWVAHYNNSVFHDAKDFKPERWIDESEDLKEMDASYMPVRNVGLFTTN
jgi:cytochrome P450